MLLKILEEYPGTIFGVAIGFIVGLIFLFVGFWKTIVFLAFILIGLYIGKKFDHREDFHDILEEILPDKFFK